MVIGVYLKYPDTYVLRSHIQRSERVQHLLKGFYTVWWSQSLPRPDIEVNENMKI